MNEAKPFSSKIREYKDGKQTPIEYIKDQMISDSILNTENKVDKLED